MTGPARPDRRARPVGGLSTLAAIAVGGCLGGAARYGIASALPHDSARWPWSTLTVNLVGAFALALLFAVTRVHRPHRLVVPLLGSGVLGGFTTFSTWVLDVDTLGRSGSPWTAAGYLVGTIVGGLLAAVAGLALGRAITSGTVDDGSRA